MTSSWPADVVRLRDVVARDLGLRLDDGKLPALGELLARRLEQHRDGAAAYVDRLEAHADPRELRALASALTVGETYFFRNVEQFRALVEAVLPARVAARATERTVRLLSAGCASGEEPYSMAIAAREACGPGWHVVVRAVDVNPDAIARATRGRYSQWAMRETTPDLEARWFRRDGNELVLDASVREAVRFDERNLVEDDAELWAAGSYDVVFCRNVTMYFTPAQQQAVIDRITHALVPGGTLFLGHAETLRGVSNDYHLRHTHGAFYYQRKDVLAPADAEEPPAPREESAAAPATSGPGWAAAWLDTIRTSADRIRELSERARAAPERQAPSIAIESTPAASGLGHTLELLRRERYDEALADLDREPVADRDRDVLLVRAALLAHSGRVDEAERACVALLEIDELSAGAHYLLALCRERCGDLRAAADHDQVAAYLDPSFAMPRLHLGLMARRAGDGDGARRELEQAALLLPREDASRLLLFGGGFAREALIAMCAEPRGPR